MRRGTNCRNERNEMMESCWVLLHGRYDCVMMANARNAFLETKAGDRVGVFTRRRHDEQLRAADSQKVFM